MQLLSPIFFFFLQNMVTLLIIEIFIKLRDCKDFKHETEIWVSFLQYVKQQEAGNRTSFYCLLKQMLPTSYQKHKHQLSEEKIMQKVKTIENVFWRLFFFP